MNNVIDLIARICIALLFFFEAYDSIFYYKLTLDKMTNYGIVWQQDLLLMVSIFILIIGGIMLLIGYRSKLAALALLMYWIPLTFVVHSWWNDPEEIRRVQSQLFIKNIAIMGGLLLILVYGSGKYSVKRLIDSRKIRA